MDEKHGETPTHRITQSLWVQKDPLEERERGNRGIKTRARPAKNQEGTRGGEKRKLVDGIRGDDKRSVPHRMGRSGRRPWKKLETG